jgi:hypothetical protein
MSGNSVYDGLKKKDFAPPSPHGADGTDAVNGKSDKDVLASTAGRG